MHPHLRLPVQRLLLRKPVQLLRHLLCLLRNRSMGGLRGG